MDREKLRDIINTASEKMNQKLTDMGYFDEMTEESRLRVKENQNTPFNEIFNLSIDMATTISSTVLLEVFDQMFTKGILKDNSESVIVD